MKDAKQQPNQRHYHTQVYGLHQSMRYMIERILYGYKNLASSRITDQIGYDQIQAGKPE